MFMVINSWLFWLHIFNTADYLLLNILTIVYQSLFTLTGTLWN